MPYSIEDYKMCLEGLKSDDCDLRRESAEDLGYSEIDEAALELVGYLTDDDKGVRDAVANSLKKLNYQPVAYELVEYLKNQQIDIRNYASDILVNMQEKAVPALLKMLNDPDHDARKFSADILGLIKTDKSLPELILHLDDADANVVVSAIEALGNLGNQQAIAPLIQKAHRDPELMAMVLDALGKISSDKVNSLILESLSHDDAITVFSAVETIGQIGTLDHLPLLFKQLNQREDFFSAPILLAVIRVLTRYKVSLTNNPDLLNIAEEIIVAAFSEEEVIDEFSENLTSVEMLLNLPFFLKFHRFLKKDAKIKLLSALQKNYRTEFNNLFAQLLNDRDSWIVFKTCDLIAEHKIVVLESNLIEILKSGVVMLEIGAIKALGTLKSESALKHLELLKAQTQDDDVIKEIQSAVMQIIAND